MMTTAFQHDTVPAIGVLVLNLGTPDTCSKKDVKRYLKEFLWDPRVVEVPRPLWWLVLNFVILNTRPKRSAAAMPKFGQSKAPPYWLFPSCKLKPFKRSFRNV